MNEKNKEYEEYFKIFEQKPTRQNTGAPRAAQGRKPPRPGIYLSKKRQSAKRRRQKRRRIAVISAVAVLLLILAIILICKGCSGNHDLTVLQGAWRYDEYTEYEFDGKGNGCMCLDSDSHFEYTYVVEGNTVKLNFELDYVTDCEYTFTASGNTLTLIGGKGTAEPGKEYTLTKQKE